MEQLGQMLLNAQLITREQLHAAAAEQRRVGLGLGSCLIGLGMAPPRRISEVVLRHLNAQPIGESQIAVDPELLRRIPEEVALDYELLPLRASGETLEVVIAEPSEYVGLDELMRRTGFREIVVRVAAPSVIRRLIARHYGKIRAKWRPQHLCAAC